MRSTKSKEQIFRDGFSCFVNGHIPDDIFNGYMNDIDGEGVKGALSFAHERPTR